MSPQTPPCPPPTRTRTVNDDEDDISNAHHHVDSFPQQTTSTSTSSSSSLYSTSMLEVPMFYLLLCGTQIIRNTIIPFVYQIRWALSYPLRTVIVPHWIPNSCGTASSLYQITIGELLLCTPLIIWFIEAYYTTFISQETTTPNGKSTIDTTGYLALYTMTFTYCSANKSNSLFTFIFGIPFDRIIWFHNVSAITTVVLSCFHIYVSYTERSISTLRSYLVQDSINVTGTIAIASMLALITVSIHSKILRAYAFQLWLYSHIILAVTVLVAMFLHSGVSPVLLFITVWWGLDVLVRYCFMISIQYRIDSNNVQIRRICASTNAAAAAASAGNSTPDAIVEISFPKPKGFVYNAGQFVQIAIPSISIFEFHPVTISSSPYEPNITFHIKQRGDWTKRLVALCDSNQNNPNPKPIAIWMEGPYGNISVDINDTQRYQMVVLLCGGIGITPCQSIGKQLLYEIQQSNITNSSISNSPQRPMKHLHMIWSVRDMNLVRDIPPLGGPDIVNPIIQESPNTNVQVDIYCTNKENQDMERQDSFRTNHPYQTVLCGQRPNLDSIFTSLQEKAVLEYGETNIAVIACGPPSFLQEIKMACRTYSQSSIPTLCCKGGKNNNINPKLKSTDGVYFDLHTEIFEY